MFGSEGANEGIFEVFGLRTAWLALVVSDWNSKMLLALAVSTADSCWFRTAKVLGRND